MFTLPPLSVVMAWALTVLRSDLSPPATAPETAPPVVVVARDHDWSEHADRSEERSVLRAERAARSPPSRRARPTVTPEFIFDEAIGQ